MINICLRASSEEVRHGSGVIWSGRSRQKRGGADCRRATKRLNTLATDEKNWTLKIDRRPAGGAQRFSSGTSVPPARLTDCF
ncbi:hypothetical protein J6590_088611 [Homalodisca vitripennis]|nr:hypothetical protein J6590_088611 [Homalodisca vitripennis]